MEELLEVLRRPYDEQVSLLRAHAYYPIHAVYYYEMPWRTPCAHSLLCAYAYLHTDASRGTDSKMIFVPMQIPGYPDTRVLTSRVVS